MSSVPQPAKPAVAHPLDARVTPHLAVATPCSVAILRLGEPCTVLSAPRFVLSMTLQCAFLEFCGRSRVKKGAQFHAFRCRGSLNLLQQQLPLFVHHLKVLALVHGA